jgi:hypothetical protein
MRSLNLVAGAGSAVSSVGPLFDTRALTDPDMKLRRSSCPSAAMGARRASPLLPAIESLADQSSAVGCRRRSMRPPNPTRIPIATRMPLVDIAGAATDPAEAGTQAMSQYVLRS